MKGDIQAEEAPMKGRLLLGALPIVLVAVPVGEEGSTWRLRPTSFLAPSYPRTPPTPVVLTD